MRRLGVGVVSPALWLLVLALLLPQLFAAQGGNLAPQACIAQAGFMCTDLTYGTNAIQLYLGQKTGDALYNVNAFITAEGQALDGNGIPVNFTTSNAIALGTMVSGGWTAVVFPASLYAAGDIPPYTSTPVATGLAMGTPFAGYVWLAYCTQSNCTNPTNRTKVATVLTKSTSEGPLPPPPPPLPLNIKYAGEIEQVSGLVIAAVLTLVFGARKRKARADALR